MKSQGGQKRGEAEEEESQEVLNFVSFFFFFFIKQALHLTKEVLATIEGV